MTEPKTEASLAEKLYTAYRTERPRPGFSVDHRGMAHRLPEWHELDATRRMSWERIAEAAAPAPKVNAKPTTVEK